MTTASAATLYTRSYGYDKNGRRKSLTYPSVLADASGNPDVAQYGYEVHGDLGSIAIAGRTFGFGYDAAGRFDSLMYANGVYERSTFDDDGRALKRFQRGPNYQGFLSAGRKLPSNPSFTTDTIHSDLFSYDARGKMLAVSSLTDSAVNVYQGLGALYSVQHESLYPGAGAWDTQTYVIDALGNRFSLTYQQLGLNDPTPTYARYTGRLVQRVFSGVSPKDTMTYDAAGNEAMRRVTKFIPNGEGTGTIQVADSTVEGYDVDGHLRTVSMQVRRIVGTGTLLPFNGAQTDTTHYDALGRRVWARTVYGDGSCGSQCTELSSVTRFVWDGSQILGEIRDRGGVSTSDTEMENDAPIVFDSLPCSFSAEVPCDTTPTARPHGLYSAHVGRVEYVHGGGIDQPVLVIRRDYGGDSTFFGDIDIYPHANWRGETDQVTFFNGRGDYGSNQTHPVVELPAKNELGFHQTKEAAAGPLSWNGSLLAQQRDASGLMYMRNRYYDPTTGRFTQEDPIGIAGGVNLYGFAGGDPISNADPFGLCPGLPKCGVVGNFLAGIHAGIQGLSDVPEGVNKESKSYKLGFVVGAFAGVLADLSTGDQEGLLDPKFGNDPEIRATQNRIAGNQPKYKQDGTVFKNREGKLPQRDDGYYSEWTVDTPGATNRGARRIVTGAQGEQYYTDDHYGTFTLIKPAPQPPSPNP